MMTLTDKNKEYAVIPMNDYLKMSEIMENYEDILSIEKAKLAIQSGEDELIPLAIMERLVSEESNLKVWREYRNLSPKQLSQQTGIGVSTISKIENNKQSLDIAKVKKIADVLDLDVEDLVD